MFSPCAMKRVQSFLLFASRDLISVLVLANRVCECVLPLYGNRFELLNVVGADVVM